MGAYIDLTDNTFGLWTVLSRHSVDKNKNTTWNCICECGNESIIVGDNLRRGLSTSCGCNRGAKISASKIRHGHDIVGERTTEYRCWLGIKKRCYNKNDWAFKWYGARSPNPVIVCGGMRYDFAYFLSIIGLKPSPELEIDRTNNEGSYTCGRCEDCVENKYPRNIEWVTRKQNMMNRRNTQFVTYNEETLSYEEWELRTGIPAVCIRQRIVTYKWTPERALTQPVRKFKNANHE